MPSVSRARSRPPSLGVLIDPPYRIVTERLVLRCWEPRDAPLLKDAIDSSLDHLQAWMPWALEEPQPLEEKVQLLRRFGELRSRPGLRVRDLLRDETEVIGGTGLHTRVGEGAFEIGYWIRESRVRAGFATESTAAVTRVGFEVCGVDRIEIRVDPAMSRAWRCREARLLGGSASTASLTDREGEEPRDVIVFTLFRDELGDAGGLCSEAFDARGGEVWPGDPRDPARAAHAAWLLLTRPRAVLASTRGTRSRSRARMRGGG